MQVNTEGWFKCEIEVMVVLFYLLINDNFTGHKGQLFVWNSMRFPFEYRGKYLNGIKSISSCLPLPLRTYQYLSSCPNFRHRWLIEWYKHLSKDLSVCPKNQNSEQNLPEHRS